MLRSFQHLSRPLLSGWARFASKTAYDVIVVGGGSVGPSIAYTLAENRIKTALVESNHGTGLGQNRAAIGGVRATHSSAAKISVCLRSLEILRSWQKDFGDDIEYHEGGYFFPLFDEPTKKIMTGLLPYQKSWGLNIDFIQPNDTKKLVPGISEENLLGGIYSPEDANVSPLLTTVAISRRLQRSGATTYFGKRATRLLVSHGNKKIAEGVELDDGTVLKSDIVIDATGGWEDQILMTSAGLKPLPIIPDAHEAGITEPVEKFFEPLIVDIRPRKGSKNFYFYQNGFGQIIFCLTPDPLFIGRDMTASYQFLPLVAQRMLEVIPRLKNVRVRRVWRGLYPMTPDAQPIVGWNQEAKGLFHANGMCGQGFMVGPALGETVFRMVKKGEGYSPNRESRNSSERTDAAVIEEFHPYRKFESTEALK